MISKEESTLAMKALTQYMSWLKQHPDTLGNVKMMREYVEADEFRTRMKHRLNTLYGMTDADLTRKVYKFFRYDKQYFYKNSGETNEKR